MKSYMVICIVDGRQSAGFYGSYPEARDAKMGVECGMGGYAEIYIRNEDEDGMDAYVLLES